MSHPVRLVRTTFVKPLSCVSTESAVRISYFHHHYLNKVSFDLHSKKLPGDYKIYLSMMKHLNSNHNICPQGIFTRYWLTDFLCNLSLAFPTVGPVVFPAVPYVPS